MANSANEVREEISKTQLKEIDGFKPVIVKTEYKKNKFSFGVQFWSQFLINQGYSRNTDNTVALFVEMF